MVVIVFNFLFVAVLAKLLGADAYGYIPLARSGESIVEGILEFGIGVSIVKHLSISKNKKTTIGTAFTLKLILGTIGTVGVALFAIFFTAPPMDAYLLAISPLLFIGLMLVNIRCIYQYFIKLKESIILAAVPDVARFFLSVGLVVAGFGILGGILGWVLGYLIALVIGVLLLMRDNLYAIRWKAKEAKSLLNFGIFFNSAQLSMFFFPPLITIIAGVFLTIHDVSIIAVSLAFATIIYLFIGPMAIFVYPLMCENQKDPKFKTFLRFLFRYWLVFVFVLSIGIFLSSSFVFGLLGESFLDGSEIFWVLSLAIFLDSFKNISDQLFAALNKARNVFYAESMKFVVFFAAFMLLLVTNSVTLLTLSFAILASYSAAFLVRFTLFLRQAPIEKATLVKGFFLFLILLALGFIGFTGVQKALVFVGFIALILATKLFKLQDLKYIQECIR